MITSVPRWGQEQDASRLADTYRQMRQRVVEAEREVTRAATQVDRATTAANAADARLERTCVRSSNFGVGGLAVGAVVFGVGLAYHSALCGGLGAAVACGSLAGAGTYILWKRKDNVAAHRDLSAADDARRTGVRASEGEQQKLGSFLLQDRKSTAATLQKARLGTHLMETANDPAEAKRIGADFLWSVRDGANGVGTAAQCVLRATQKSPDAVAARVRHAILEAVAQGTTFEPKQAATVGPKLAQEKDPDKAVALMQELYTPATADKSG